MDNFWDYLLTKWQVDEMASLLNGKSVKLGVDEIASWWNGKLMKLQVVANGKITKWQYKNRHVDEIESWWNCELMKWKLQFK